jgi:hypothetical protein
MNHLRRRPYIALLALAIAAIALTGASMARAAFNTPDPIPGQVRYVGIDTNTSGNTFTSVSSVETSTLVAASYPFTIDVVVDEIDPSDGLAGVEGSLIYNPAYMHVVSIDSDSLVFQNPDVPTNQFRFIDSLPDTDGEFHFSYGDLQMNNDESGEGVAVRITMQCDNPQVTTLSLQDGFGGPQFTLYPEAAHNDPGAQPLFVQTQDTATISCGLLSGTPTPPPTGPTPPPPGCRGISPTPTSTATPTPTPTWNPHYSMSICNDTAGAATDLHVILQRAANNAPVTSNPPGCPAPSYNYSGGTPPDYTAVDITWSSPCVDQGEAVGLDFIANCVTPQPGCSVPAITCFYWTLNNTPVPSVSPAVNPSTCSTPDADGDGIRDDLDNCPNWANSNQALPAWPVPSGDADCDGFLGTNGAANSAPEVTIGTDPLKHCAADGTQDNEPSPDAWPVDFNDNRIVNGQDVAKFQPAYNKPVSAGPFGGLPGQRFDFSGNNIINGQDIARFAAYYNKSCA